MPLKKNPAPAATAAAPVAPVAKKPCGCGPKAIPPATMKLAAGVTRKSCVECVEKHLGAAWVLLTETREGYPHRLFAIGHLHEAEDESQAWPKLHAAIRDARKTYQSRGVMPDFARLAEIVAGVTTPAPAPAPPVVEGVVPAVTASSG